MCDHQAQTVRTAIDILLALGLVTETKTHSVIEIEWNTAQESALARIEQVTRECCELRRKRQEIEREIGRLNSVLEQTLPRS
jgi:predicted Holliday junction resolvase-like endonuclease